MSGRREGGWRANWPHIRTAVLSGCTGLLMGRGTGFHQRHFNSFVTWVNRNEAPGPVRQALTSSSLRPFIFHLLLTPYVLRQDPLHITGMKWLDHELVDPTCKELFDFASA